MVSGVINKICQFCGYQRPIDEERYEQEKVDLELKQLKRQDILQNQSHDYYKQLKTFDQLVAFQKEKKYKFAWVLRKAEELGIKIPGKYTYMMNKFVKKRF